MSDDSFDMLFTHFDFELPVVTPDKRPWSKLSSIRFQRPIYVCLSNNDNQSFTNASDAHVIYHVCISKSINLLLKCNVVRVASCSVHNKDCVVRQVSLWKTQGLKGCLAYTSARTCTIYCRMCYLCMRFLHAF